MLLILHLNVLLSGEGAFLLNLIHQPKPWKCENHIGAVPSWGPRKLWAKLLLFYLFSSSTPHPMMNKCEFQRNWGGGGEGGEFKLGKLKLHIFSYLGVTLSSGKLALSLLHFPKGILPNNLTDISLSDASLGTQVYPFQALTNEMKWQAWTAGLLSTGLCFASSKSRIQKQSV